MRYKIKTKLITICIAAMFVASVLTCIFTSINYNNYVKSNNETVLRMASILLEKENLTKDELVHIFESNEVFDLSVLQQYGYTIDTKYFLEVQKENYNKSLITNILAVNSAVILLVIVFNFFSLKRRKEIDDLIYYLQQLNNKNYNLEIDENSENELSRLKKELYQMTIFLKQQAENSLSDKIAVKDNIVNISHQLKTPLTAISIMLDNIIEFPNMDEETKNNFLLDVRSQVIHIEFLLQNLLKLSKFDANVIEFNSREVSANELVQNCLNTLKAMISSKQIDVEFNGDENANFIGDFLWQSEAICNIIKNAIEHSSINGKLKISISSNSFNTKISIKDYGVGIKKENLKKVFTRFFKDENSNNESLGVGLNLSKLIIEKGNGNIMLTSVEGKGSIFDIRYQK